MRTQRGFTLLEAICAFLILALITAQVSQIFWNNVRKGAKALSHRELREAADTIFRKMIYEWELYKDGDSRTLDEEYAEFADLEGMQRDRWAEYRYDLEKKRQSVVGSSIDGEDTLFGEESSVMDSGTETESETGSEGEAPAEAAGGESGDETGIELIRMTLKLYRTEQESDEPILTLTTWIDPDRGRTGR